MDEQDNILNGELLDHDTSQEKVNMEDAVKDLRRRYEQSLTLSESSAAQIGDMVRVVDMGQVEKQLEEAMGEIAEMSATDSKVNRLAMKFLPASWVKNASKKRAEKSVEGSTVSDVAERMIKSLTARRDKVEETYEKMESLSSDIVSAYHELDVIVADIDTQLESDELTNLQRSKLEALKLEIGLQRANHESNITTSKSALVAADLSLQKLAEMLPGIRSNINDGLAIRGYLKEIANMTKTTAMIMELTETVREENMQVVEEELIKVIQSSGVSDKQLASIQKASQDRIKMQKNVQIELNKVSAQKQKALGRLESINMKSADNLLGFEFSETQKVER